MTAVQPPATTMNISQKNTECKNATEKNHILMIYLHKFQNRQK